MSIEELFLLSTDNALDMDIRYAIVRQMQQLRNPSRQPFVTIEVLSILHRTAMRRELNRKGRKAK